MSLPLRNLQQEKNSPGGWRFNSQTTIQEIHTFEPLRIATELLGFHGNYFFHTLSYGAYTTN